MEQEQASSFIDPALRRQSARTHQEALDAEQRFWLDAALRIHRRLLHADATISSCNGIWMAQASGWTPWVKLLLLVKR